MNTDNSNMFMAATMLPFLIPFYMEISKSSYITAILIAFSGLSSALYHLHESQKHQLMGFSLSPTLSSPSWNYLLINVDRLGAVMLGSWKLMHLRDFSWIRDGAIAIGLMALSETVYRHEQTNYMILHTMWHLMAAYLLCVY